MIKVERDIHTIDAEGKAPGRIATEVTQLLIGKHKPNFTPNIDGGDHVQVINAAKMKISGKKLDQKMYYRHSGYAGGLNEQAMSDIWTDDPSEIVRRSVSRMLPKNKQRNERMKRLAVSN
ncbi:50S ribosomal protein L13 [Candidatus Uhrbacteria bacterium CG_4_9_14_3_um_filter_50_9]|uniref:Large ribosomal subunit protein uL13 n=1 Tax=Candidatus Uhrbacteria bacterium CG_4_9_14_3_um_filter_50_9 TaxID=1975035 RepID=A0A2M7XDS8_9BACT|nr:MAG: 50S ribosomal protein L13 [Candidatus Uhrbacteria bacterium CG_4_9_14_3_um_filter_50_9]